MFAQFKFNLLRRPSLRRQGVRTESSSYCDATSTFEGGNRITAHARVLKSHLGFGSYVGDHSTVASAFVGRYTSIGPKVDCVIGTHPTAFVSTHPAFFSTRAQAGFTLVDKDRFAEFGSRRFADRYLVEIGSDVWIGHGAKIMQGVRIGHGAVIAAGSVVTKDVEPYAIVAGVPARLLKYRFEESIRQRLLASAWWNFELPELRRLASRFDDPEAFLDAFASCNEPNPLHEART